MNNEIINGVNDTQEENKPMTKEELNAIISEMPEKVSIGDAVWFRDPLKKMPLWPMKDVTNIMEVFPNEAVVDGHLVCKYDNAWQRKRGVTPTKEDYENLFDKCTQIEVEGDNGILLKDKAGVYFYLPEGEYWTSSLTINDVGKYLPYSITVADGKPEISITSEPSALHNIICIDKDV